MAFLIFNFAPARIFMGDSGSMLIGAVLSVLAIRLIEHDVDKMPEILGNISTPVMAMSILSYPLVDTIRVFFIRAVRGGSPFIADRNHIHHALLANGLSHRSTVLTVYIINLVVVGLAILSAQLHPTVAFLAMLVIAAGLYQLAIKFTGRNKAGL